MQHCYLPTSPRAVGCRRRWRLGSVTSESGMQMTTTLVVDVAGRRASGVVKCKRVLQATLQSAFASVAGWLAGAVPDAKQHTHLDAVRAARFGALKTGYEREPYYMKFNVSNILG
uniref:Uncharacterized protein n=1 Tax=Romanomermis culicivorax TaxID=13658 RepID=A0A915IZD1_ROMCU